MSQQSSVRDAFPMAALRLRLCRSQAKALSFDSGEYGAKPSPEREFRGVNVNSLRAPPKSRKSHGENPNLTGNVSVGQIWFRLWALRAAACQGELREARGRSQTPNSGASRLEPGRRPMSQQSSVRDAFPMAALRLRLCRSEAKALSFDS